MADLPPNYPIDWYPILAINIPATSTDLAFVTRGGRLFGWAVEESTGSATAKLELMDGTSNNGQRIVPITLLANESTRDVWGKPGVLIQTGVWLHLVAGSVRGTIYFLPLSEEEILRQAGYQVAG